MSNHLIIGIGGTGGKIIREFKKTIFTEFHNQTPPNERNLYIEYLYIDSSEEYMKPEDPSWKTLGQSVQLGLNSQLKIKGGNLREIITGINNYPGLKPWLGNESTWDEILAQAAIGEAVGGQRRRLGRFLFALKIEDFLKMLSNKVQYLQEKSGEVDVNFHVCCGLAGGTGGGAFIDVITQLRKRYTSPPGEKRFKILLYLLLPDNDPKPGWDAGNYHANGYGALLELNALLVGAFNPHDISGKLVDREGNARRIENLDRFNGCYLFSNENDCNHVVDVEYKVPKIISDFLYQKTVVVHDEEGEWKRTLVRMENAENAAVPFEKDEDNIKILRGNRFLAFGIKRIAVPEEEIREYLTYNYGYKAMLQFLFNNWSDDIGFKDESSNIDYLEYVKGDATKEKWMMTDNHLIYSFPLLKSDKRDKHWKTFEEFWSSAILKMKEIAKTQDNWVDALQSMCDERYTAKFRDFGVRDYFHSKLVPTSRGSIVKELVDNIKNELFEDWRNNSRSLYDIQQLLNALINLLDQRQKEIGDNASAEGKIAALRNDIPDIQRRIDENKAAWARIGPLSALWRKKHRILDAQAINFQKLYTINTKIQGWEFARRLVADIITNLMSLMDDITYMLNLFESVKKDMSSKVASRLNDAKKTQNEKIKEHVIRFYEANVVTNIKDRLLRNEEEQKRQAYSLKKLIVDQLGEQKSFETFRQRITFLNLIDKIEEKCQDNVLYAHNTLITLDREKVLDTNILVKLRDRYSTNEQELRAFIRQLVNQAGIFAVFNENEIKTSAPGIPDPTLTCQSTFSVIIPKDTANEQFVRILKNAFTESTPEPIIFIEAESNKKNEIAIVRVKNLFPIRFLFPVRLLKEKYTQRMNSGDAERIQTVVHLEGNGTQFPDLFLISEEEKRAELEVIRKNSIQYFLLAKGMDLLIEGKDQKGFPYLGITQKSESGLRGASVKLGENLLDSYNKLTKENYTLLKNSVESSLGNEYSSHEMQEKLKTFIIREDEKVYVERGKNELDELFILFNSGAKKAIMMLNI